jgi:prephenate dehydratase
MRAMRDRAAPVLPKPGTKVTVGYPGRDGAHSAAACDRLFPGGADLVALPSFSAVADAVAGGAVEFGVLPIESSLSGPVAETHDLLYESPLAITGETVLPIRHCLVGPAPVELEEIRIVHSHPAALDQCRRLLAAMPWATAIAAATTADAAAAVAERGDPREAAIASERAAALYGLTVIAADVGDHPEAYTRFVSIATHMRLDATGGRWRTAFSFVTDHQPGALHRAIEPFARHDIDLVQLVSRPIPHSTWRYRFDAVLDGHPLDPVVNSALTDVRGRTRQLRVFGSYPPDEQP